MQIGFMWFMILFWIYSFFFAKQLCSDEFQYTWVPHNTFRRFLVVANFYQFDSARCQTEFYKIEPTTIFNPAKNIERWRQQMKETIQTDKQIWR